MPKTSIHVVLTPEELAEIRARALAPLRADLDRLARTIERLRERLDRDAGTTTPPGFRAK